MEDEAMRVVTFVVVALMILLASPTPAGVTDRVSLGTGGTQGNGDSFQPALSWDGRFVAFDSKATDLVPGDTNGKQDVFVRDRVGGQTVRVSVASDGTQGNDISMM